MKSITNKASSVGKKKINKNGQIKNLNTNEPSSRHLALPLYLIMPFIFAFISVTLILGYYNFYNMGISNTSNTHYMYYIIFPVLSIALFAISEIVILGLKKSKIKVEHDHRFALGMILTLIISVSYVFYSLNLVKNYPTNQPQDWSNVYKVWTNMM